MKKKYLALVLAACMTLGSLAGCGNTATTETSAPVTESTEAADAADTAASTETAAEAGTEEAAASTEHGPSSEAAPAWEDYDARIAAIRTETDLAKREAMMHEAEDELMATWAIVPLYYYNDVYLQKTDVENIYSNLFGFSTAEKTQRLQAQFPYLEEVRVDVQLPGTVVVKVRPATERFACMYSGGWVVLSDARKILRSELSQPEGLTLLSCSLPADFTPEVGQTLTPQTYNSLLEGDTAATPEAARPTAEETLTQLCALLESEGLTDGVTAIDVMDQSKLSFTYQGRIVVTLGNANRLEYKVRLAAAALLDPEKGLLASDRGTLDVSYQQTDGEIRGYFAPEEPEPKPEPTPEPEEGEDGEGENGEEDTAPQE